MLMVFGADQNLFPLDAVLIMNMPGALFLPADQCLHFLITGFRMDVDFIFFHPTDKLLFKAGCIMRMRFDPAVSGLLHRNGRKNQLIYS